MSGDEKHETDLDHDRALMRAFEMRHPMLALSIRLIRRRPLSGTFVALAFVVASTIAYEGIGVINKRFSTWLDVNYVATWQSQDRTAALARGGAERERLAKVWEVHEAVALPIPANKRLAVHHTDTMMAMEPWRDIAPEESGDPPRAFGVGGHDPYFTLRSGDMLGVYRLSDGKLAQVTVDSKEYVLVHAIFAVPDRWQPTFPADFHDRADVCGTNGTVSNCPVYGYISRSDFDTLGFPETDMRLPPVAGDQILPPAPNSFDPPYGEPAKPYAPADLSGITPAILFGSDGEPFVRLPKEWIAALATIASKGFYKTPAAVETLADMLGHTTTPRLAVGTYYRPILVPYPGRPELPWIPVLVLHQDPYASIPTTGILVTIDDGPARRQQGLLRYGGEFETYHEAAIAKWRDGHAAAGAALAGAP